MKSQLLKLEAPYNVIYAGDKVGRHIATLMVWNDDEEALGGIMDAASYPVIDEGEEFPAGTLCSDAELHDCRVLCPPEGTNLNWVAKIIEPDAFYRVRSNHSQQGPRHRAQAWRLRLYHGRTRRPVDPLA